MKTTILTIRVTPNDKRKLEELARKAKITMSEWIRRAINKGD